MRRFQRRTSSYPEVIERAKRDYEQAGLGYRILAKKHGIPRSTVAFLAVKGRGLKQGEQRQEQSDYQTIARHTEREIVVEGLSDLLQNNGPVSRAEAAAGPVGPVS